MLNIEIGKPSKPPKLALILISLLVLSAIIFIVSGYNYSTVKGDCYERQKICQGIPLSETCLGIETEKIEVSSPEKCNQVKEIEERCSELRNTVCTANRSNWSKNSYVNGLSCKRWIDEYSLEVEKCQ